MYAERRTGRTGRIVGTLLVLVVAAVCIRLGFWQLSRLDEKRSRNASVESRMQEPGVELSGAVGDTAGLIFRRAVASGRYDNERSIILPGRSYQGSPGVLLLTPLRVSAGRAVLVQRGWVPTPDAVNVPLDQLRVDSAVVVHGIVLPFLDQENTLAAGAAGAEPADTFRRVWYAIDAEQLRAQFPYELLPVRLQQLPGETEERARSYPLAQPAPALDEGPHLGYAIQWFSFALIALIGWVALMRSTRKATA